MSLQKIGSGATRRCPPESGLACVRPKSPGNNIYYCEIAVWRGNPRRGQISIAKSPSRSRCVAGGKACWRLGPMPAVFRQAESAAKWIGGHKGVSRYRSGARGRSRLKTTACARSRSPCLLRASARARNSFRPSPVPYAARGFPRGPKVIVCLSPAR